MRRGGAQGCKGLWHNAGTPGAEDPEHGDRRRQALANTRAGRWSDAFETHEGRPWRDKQGARGRGYHLASPANLARSPTVHVALPGAMTELGSAPTFAWGEIILSYVPILAAHAWTRHAGAGRAAPRGPPRRMPQNLARSQHCWKQHTPNWKHGGFTVCGSLDAVKARGPRTLLCRVH
eukprot:4001487-Prymnesium_polylepis.1